MSYDLVICGVGGQGVLTIAWVIDHAAHEAGLHFKQSEVHGMAQRGGAVSAFVRLSEQPVASDLIAKGCASLVLSMEPMEALRYAELLRPEGCIVCDVVPLENDAYPRHDALYQVLFSVPRLIVLDAMRLATRAGTVKAQNMVVLGAAAKQLPLPLELLEKQVQALFAPKGERIIKANLNAFRIGVAASGFASALLALGVPSDLLARVMARIQFEPQAVSQAGVEAWAERLLAADGRSMAMRLFEAGVPVPLNWSGAAA